MRKLMLMFLGLTLVGCEPSLDNQNEKVFSFFKKNRYGSSPDQAIVKINFAGERERVVIVYGFMDDDSVCRKLADKLNEEEPNSYSCEQVNMGK